MGRIVILNPSFVILSKAKDLFLLRVNSVKDLSQNDPLSVVFHSQLARIFTTRGFLAGGFSWTNWAVASSRPVTPSL